MIKSMAGKYREIIREYYNEIESIERHDQSEGNISRRIL